MQQVPSDTTYGLLDLALFSGRIDTLRYFIQWLDLLIADGNTVEEMTQDSPHTTVAATHYILERLRQAVVDTIAENEQQLLLVIQKIAEESTE